MSYNSPKKAAHLNRPYESVEVESKRFIKFYRDCPLHQFTKGKFKRAYLEMRRGQGFGHIIWEVWFENTKGFRFLMAESKHRDLAETIVEGCNETGQMMNRSSSECQCPRCRNQADLDEQGLRFIGSMRIDGKAFDWEDLSPEDQLRAIKFAMNRNVTELDVKLKDGNFQTIKIPKL